MPNNLKLQTGITVESCGGSTGPFCVKFKAHQPGDCPVLIRNYCADLYMKIQQKDQGHVSLLNPNHRVLYTWDNPCLPRILTWNIYNNKGSGFVLDILKDGQVCGFEVSLNFQCGVAGTGKKQSSFSRLLQIPVSGSLPRMTRIVRAVLRIN